MKELNAAITIKTTDDGSHCSNECPFFCFEPEDQLGVCTPFCRMFKNWTDEMKRTLGCIEVFGMPDDVMTDQSEAKGKPSR